MGQAGQSGSCDTGVGQRQRVNGDASQADALREAFRTAGIPTVVRGGPEVLGDSGISWVQVGLLQGWAPRLWRGQADGGYPAASGSWGGQVPPGSVRSSKCQISLAYTWHRPYRAPCWISQ